MSSNVEIFNLALSHIGIDKQIASFTENSKEARIAKVWFDLARNMVLRDRKWSFATKFADLALVESDPTMEWAFAYRYPSDCLEMRRILNGIPIGFLSDAPAYYGWSTLNGYFEQNKVPYKIGADSDGKLIYCSLDNAQVEYTFIAEDGIQYPPDFIVCLSYRIANFIAPALTSGDPSKLGAMALQMYYQELDKAAANSYNEEQAVNTNDSALTRARD